METENLESADIEIHESIVDLADCHTSLFYFDPSGSEGPLPFGDGAAYCELYDRVADASRGDEPDPRAFPQGEFLARLNPGYRGNKYWQRQLHQKSRENFPRFAWTHLVPFEARPGLRLSPFLMKGTEAKVLPVLRVLLYPFGWSTWVSLLVRGRHNLQDLSDFTVQAVKEKIFSIEGENKALLNLDSLLDLGAWGVRSDVFGGKKARDVSPPELLSVVSVVEKRGQSLALAALSASDRKLLWKLVRPDATPSMQPVREIAYPIRNREANFNFVLQDGFGAFLWLENLLQPGLRHKDHLRCYHNNTFRALLQAWQLWAFVDETVASRRKKSASPALAELLEEATGQLGRQSKGTHHFRNAALRAFLDRKDVRTSLEVAQETIKASQAKAKAKKKGD